MEALSGGLIAGPYIPLFFGIAAPIFPGKVTIRGCRPGLEVSAIVMGAAVSATASTNSIRMNPVRMLRR